MSLFPLKAEAASHDQYVKIGLKFGSSAVNSCTIKSEDGFLLGTADDRDFDEGMPLPAYTEIKVTNENGNIVIRDKDGVLLSSDLGSSGCIMPADYDEDGILYFNDTPYRDGIMFLANANGTLTVINYLTMEHYVYGVLNCELNYTNPIEALKAQAVAARSFGQRNLGKHSASGFDFCTSTDCQVYKGYSDEHPETNDAVDETREEAIYYDGKPVSAYYFKNSGGYTQNSEDVWSGCEPYLRAVKDEYSPSYPWSTSLSFDIIKTKLEGAGYAPGTIESVSISSKNDNGAVSELEIKGSASTVTLKKENIRNVLGATIIKSNRFSLADSTTSAGSSSWFISNGFSKASFGKDTYVIGGSGKVRKLDDDSAYGSNGVAAVRLGASKSVETVTGGVVNFNGFGYGHGVGMPQDSAVEMANQGFDYEEILKYYFTDIEIQ
jgi:SpoIID/LytB domain